MGDRQKTFKSRLKLHFTDKKYNLWKAPFYIVAEPEIPGKTNGKVEEEKGIKALHSKEVHNEIPTQKHTSVIPVLWPFLQF